MTLKIFVPRFDRFSLNDLKGIAFCDTILGVKIDL